MSEPIPKHLQIDCIQMKREIQAKIYEETNHMSPAELLEYYRRKAETGPFAEARARALARQQEQNRDVK